MADARNAIICQNGNCAKPADGACCSSHRRPLCHQHYRLTHWVEVCVEECEACAAEKLPLILRWDTR